MASVGGTSPATASVPIGGNAPSSVDFSPSTGANGVAMHVPGASASIRRVDTLATSEDLARAVVSVFGDTAALHPVPPTDLDAEPIWDIDVRSYETHQRVTHYVQLFSTSSRETFRARLSRGTRYEPMIRAKLRAGGMPEDLTYLALIESGYDPHAYSRAAAVGLWQFMSSTARDVGLRVDWWVDERRDPVRATEGAIRFLGYLQQQFGSLYLAAAAYNGGPGRVSRGLTRYAGEMDGAQGDDRFFALAEQNYLRAETKNYVPQLIAAALIAKKPSRYGMNVDSLALWSYDSVLVDAGTSLAAVVAASHATDAEIRELNPAVLRGMVPPDRAMWLHVPTGRGASTATALLAIPDAIRLGYSTARVSGTTTTLATIAKTSGVPSQRLAWFNPGLKTAKRGRLVAGQTVRIPTSGTLSMARAVPDPSIERYGSGTSSTVSSQGGHVVRRGETLGSISRRYGVSVARLKALNGISGSRLVAGQTLRVRSTARTASRSTSSTTRSRTSSARSSNASSKSASTTTKGSASPTRKRSASKSATSASKKSVAKKSATSASKKSVAKKSTTSASKKSVAKKPATSTTAKKSSATRPSKSKPAR